MTAESVHVPFDPTKFDDELLVVLAQFGSRSAERELMSRYYQMVKDKISFLARKMKLPRQEVPDAQEQGMLWFHEAIGRYKIVTQPAERRRSFRSSVNWLLGKRFLNLVKRHRWTQKRFDRSERAVRKLEEATVPLIGLSLPSRCQGDGGALLPFEEDEFRRRLEWAVKQLRPELQDLWQCVKAGRKTDWIAKDLAVSRRTILRWKAELRVELQRRLGQLTR
jgi:hypothetical protein